MLNSEVFINSLPIYSYYLHGFTFAFLIMCFDRKHASLILYLLIINPLLLPLDALICVLSVFRYYKTGMAWRMRRKHAKVEGVQEVEGTEKLSY